MLETAWESRRMPVPLNSMMSFIIDLNQEESFLIQMADEATMT